MRISDWTSDVCSSDLAVDQMAPILIGARAEVGNLDEVGEDIIAVEAQQRIAVDEQGRDAGDQHDIIGEGARSEEHTSELQSLMRNSYAVFCLKKKIRQTYTEVRQQAINKTLENEVNTQTC